MLLSRGERLKLLRQQKGVEQQEAAAAIGISGPYLSLLERDKKGRNIDHLRVTLEKAAHYYGVIPAYLLAETPQEYMGAFVLGLGSKSPVTFGERLALVLAEIRLRWGEEFHEQRIANALGTTVEVLHQYMAGRVQVSADMVEALSQFTGVPVEWLLPRLIDPPGPDPEIQRVVEYARSQGMEAQDLKLLIDAWVIGRNRKPSG